MPVTPFVVQPTGIGWPDYITAISDPSSIAQAVYFDSVAGSAGTNYPTGTASEPVNNLPDLRTICTNRGIHKIVNIDISVLITLDAAMLNYEFNNWFLDLGGRDVAGSQFKNCSVIGIAGGTSLYVENSILSNITNLGQPYLSGCVVNNNFILPTGVGVSAALINCKYLNCSLYVNDNTVDLVGGEGTLIIRDVDDAASVLNVYGFGGYINLIATCVAGTINLYGDFVLTNNAGAGCTVNDYRISKEYGEDTVYFDSVGGEAGTDYPIGTATRPVDNLPDLRAILAARNLKTIKVLSPMTLDADMEGYIFQGSKYIVGQIGGGFSPLTYEIDTNGFSINGSMFVDAVVNFSSQPAVDTETACFNCHVLGEIQSIYLDHCFIWGTISIVGGGGGRKMIHLYDCFSGEATLDWVAAGGLGAECYVLGFVGSLIVDNMILGTDNLIASSHDGMIGLNASCTNGSAYIFGTCRFTDASTLPAVWDYRTNRGITNIVSTLDFWSLPQEEVQLTDAVGDKALPNVVVAGIPTGAMIIRVVAMFKCRAIENTFAGANNLDGAQEIQVRDDSPSAWVDAINFVDNQFTIAATTREGGDMIMGSLDVKATVDGNDTYNFQWDEAIADDNNLQFNDVQVGLRIYFTP